MCGFDDWDGMPDSELVRLAQLGNLWAFAAIVHRYHGKLSAYAGKLLASSEDVQEVVQNTFIAVSRNLKDFRAEACFFTWVYKILKNQIIDRYRTNGCQKNSMLQATDTALLENIVENCGNYPEKQFINKELKLAIVKAIKTLPPKLQTPAELYWLENMTLESIAEKLSTPAGTIRSKIHRAKKLLQKQLQPYRE